MELSAEARDVIAVTQELKLLDHAGVQMLQQLFAHRVNQGLAQQLVIGRERNLARALFAVAHRTATPVSLGYVLRFLADLCRLCPSLVQVFAIPENQEELFHGVDPAQYFIDTVATHSKDSGIFCPSIFLLGTVLRQSEGDVRPGIGKKFLDVVAASVAQGPSLPSLEHVMVALCEFLRKTSHRPLVRAAKLVPQLPLLLSRLLEKDASGTVQLTYEVLLAMRLCSFDYECLADLHEAKAIPIVHRALQMAAKEKCIRMSLFVLRSFTKAQATYAVARTGDESVGTAAFALARCNKGRGPSFYGDLVGVGLLKTLHMFAKKKFGDDDIAKEVEGLVEVLDQNLDGVTSYSEYRGELLSGVLEWSPVHTSEKFWKENCKKFDEGDSLAELCKLLLSSTSDVTQAVACHDIGELVRYHPLGRALLDQPTGQGVKERIMLLMSSEHPDVAKNALNAVQKILVDRS